MMMARCIALTAKNMDEPASCSMKNAGQGVVRLTMKAESASQMARAFHTTTVVQTHRPVLVRSR